jgi:hypothetical protein
MRSFFHNRKLIVLYLHKNILQKEGRVTAFIDNRKVWRISPGKGHFQWKRGTWQDQKVISIGWEELGNLQRYATVDEVKTTAKSLHIKKPGYVANQLWAFKQVKKDHVAVAYGQYTILDIGIVDGIYSLQIDKFVHPNCDLYGHRIPVKWLKLGPVPIWDKEIRSYLSKNNTIFQITDPVALDFIQDLLNRSLQYRVESRIAKEIGPDGPEISYDFDEETLLKEVKENRTMLKNGKDERIDISKELQKLKLQDPPSRIQIKGKIRLRVVPTSSVSADLDPKNVGGVDIYVPHDIEKEFAEKTEEIRAFREFIVEIINKMAPGWGESIVLISMENTTRDAYRYHGRTVFNFNRYLQEKSRFFWFFVAARELAYLIHNQFDYRHNNLMRALLTEAYTRGF